MELQCKAVEEIFKEENKEEIGVLVDAFQHQTSINAAKTLDT